MLYYPYDPQVKKKRMAQAGATSTQKTDAEINTDKKPDKPSSERTAPDSNTNQHASQQSKGGKGSVDASR